MINELVTNIIRFFLLVLLQVTILNRIQLGGYLNPMVYVLFLLMLPFSTPRLLVLFIAFLTGITIDMFSDTLGLHATAAVIMAYSRERLMVLIAPRDGYEFESKPTIGNMGLNWYLSYAGILVFIHHLVLFFLESFRFAEFFSTLFRVMLSSFISLVLIFVIQYLFYYKPAGQR